MKGSNYVVRKEAGETTCMLELQTAVNPTYVADIVPEGTVFRDPWNPDASSTYELITDPADDNLLMLVYKTIGDNDRDQNGQPLAGVTVGGIVGNVWGIETALPGDSEPTAFNWEYSAEG